MSLQNHVLYDNFVLTNQVTDLLNTKLDTRSLMKHDDTLVANAGTKREINVYKYEGRSEKLGRGQGNSTRGKVTFESKEYRVELEQQVFDYTDEDVMKDPMVVEVGIDGATTIMVNEMNDKYFAEIAKAELVQNYERGQFNYDVVVDAIQKMNIEDESGLYLLVGNDLKAQLRKDADYKASRLGEVLYKGQIGTVCGVPVLHSKIVPADTAYLATREAVTCFTKKNAEVEQDRKKEERINSIIMRRVNLVALTDKTKVVKITVGE